MSASVMSPFDFTCFCSTTAANVAAACKCSGFMSAPSGNGCVGASILPRKVAGTHSHFSLNKTSKKEA